MKWESSVSGPRLRKVDGGSFMSLPRTLGELRRSAFSEERLRTRRVKDELRDNLIARLRQHDDARIFPGIVGYDDTVVPQIVNAILSRHNFILLGCAARRKAASCAP
jgi:magnesium chelatase subunit I